MERGGFFRPTPQKIRPIRVFSSKWYTQTGRDVLYSMQFRRSNRSCTAPAGRLEQKEIKHMQKHDPVFSSSELSGQGARLLARNDGCAVWQFRNESGDGTMTVYDVFPGVMLSFNDFHMAHYESSYVPGRRLFAVDHCREGRMEYAAGANAVAYTGAGDMKLDLRRQHTGVFRFPSSHYHGLTAAFDLDIACAALPDAVREFPVSPEHIIARWQLGDYPRVLHGMDAMEHIFGELYRVPEQIRIPYFKVKILEMLLYLDTIGIPDEDGERPYFYRSQVEKIKAIHDFLLENLSEHFTQEALSRRFGLPLTAMKACFRSAYGVSIGAWLTDCRMNRAAELLLREPGTDIAEIGGRVGYDSASKFAAAFKRAMKLTPSEYRRERGIRHEA